MLKDVPLEELFELYKTDVTDQIKTLTNRLDKIEEDASKEILNAKSQAFTASFRLDALTRLLMRRNVFSYDELIISISSFETWRNALIECQSINNVITKIERAIEFNKTSDIPIYADDLSLELIFKQVGGPSSATAELIVSELPCSTTMLSYLNPYLPAIKKDYSFVATPEEIKEMDYLNEIAPDIIATPGPKKQKTKKLKVK